MCGFVGATIVGEGGRIDDNLKNSVANGLKNIGYRGPDESSVICNEHYILGHCRLSIIGIGPEGQQPVEGEGKTALVFNGEIYNYKQLAKKYGIDLKNGRNSDTQVLFMLLHKYGEKIIAELEGMFAFAFRDASGRFLLARDRFGIKPLYYTISNGLLFFASELRGLPNTVLSVNFHTMKNYLASGSYPWEGDRTFFSKVYQVEAGHHVIFCSGKKETGLFAPSFDVECADESQEDLDVILARIRDRISVSDVPFCFSLSGGVDSTLGLAMFASEPARQDMQIEAITCRPFSHEFSEEDTARATAAKLGVRLHVCAPSEVKGEDEALDEIKRLTRILEAPVRSPGVFMQEAVYRAARKMGFKVIIDGEGADDLMAAYYGSISSTLAELYRVRGAKCFGTEAFIFASRTGLSWPRLMAKTARQLLREKTSSGSDMQLKSFRVSEIKDLVTRSSLPTLVHWSDRLSMRYSVEARPFYLFQDFLNWSKRLSPENALARGYNKWPLRELLDKRFGLSEVAFGTRKYGFSTTANAFAAASRAQRADPMWRSFQADATTGLATQGGVFRELGAYLFLKEYRAL